MQTVQMSEPVRTVVVGVASIREVDPVLPPAMELTGRIGAALHVVHALALPDLVLPETAGVGYAPPEVYERYMEGLEKQVIPALKGVPLPDRIVRHSGAGSPKEVLCRVAREVGADLIVVGATHHGKLGQRFFGTTAEHLVRTSSTPILLLRQSAGSVRRVLLTTDLSELSADVHETGMDVVEALRGTDTLELRSLLVVLFKAMLPPPLEGVGLEQVAHFELARFLKGRRPRVYKILERVRFGEPAKEIVAEAVEWKADLVVVGTHGRKGFDRLMLGSVAAETLRKVPCNLLVIPAAYVEALRSGRPHDGKPRNLC